MAMVSIGFSYSRGRLALALALVVIVSFISGCKGSSVALNKENFDELTRGKHVFIKFFH